MEKMRDIIIDKNFIKEKLDEFMEVTGWNLNEMTEEADLSPGTLYDWYHAKKMPRIIPFQKVCNACGFTLSEVFSSHKMEKLTAETNKLLDLWEQLDEQQKKIVIQLVEGLIVHD